MVSQVKVAEARAARQAPAREVAVAEARADRAGAVEEEAVGEVQGRKRGRPRYQPTEKDHKTVEAMAACGIPQEHIARVIGFDDPKSLRRHFRETLDTAGLKANAKVAATLFAAATSGQDIAATIFWVKCRLRWQEVNRTEISGQITIEHASARESLRARIAGIAARLGTPDSGSDG